MRAALAALAALVLVGCASATSTPSGSEASPGPFPTSAQPSIPGLTSSPAVTPTPSYTWPSTATCGRERWAIKTATDPGASAINTGNVKLTTVAALDALPAPASLPPTRITPVETTVYMVHATLTGFKEEADSDYHLILSSGGQTMIAEIPDPPCAMGSVLLAGIENARSEFDAKYHPSPLHFTSVNVPVTIIGVGFFDYQHGQDGVAPNAIELHPVISVQFGGTA